MCGEEAIESLDVRDTPAFDTGEKAVERRQLVVCQLLLGNDHVILQGRCPGAFAVSTVWPA
jgi:hypothetical protein